LGILAVVCLIVSVVLAVIRTEWTAQLFALWAIAIALLAPVLKAIF
jgi:hypothetical protein